MFDIDDLGDAIKLVSDVKLDLSLIGVGIICLIMLILMLRACSV